MGTTCGLLSTKTDAYLDPPIDEIILLAAAGSWPSRSQYWPRVARGLRFGTRDVFCPIPRSSIRYTVYDMGQIGNRAEGA